LNTPAEGSMKEAVLVAKQCLCNRPAVLDTKCPVGLAEAARASLCISDIRIIVRL
jgi:hypothetical protein